MYSFDDLKYGGRLHPFFWGDLNPNATISNGLANCTTMTYGDCLNDGWSPVTRIVNANHWHEYANGTVIPFNINDVEEGDVLEWTYNCHVAKVDRVDTDIYLNCSWYTGEHGVAVYDGHFDSRHFNSLQEMSDFFITNYPTRFYHYWTLAQENRGVGGEPQFIIKKPTIIKADKEDKTVDQIHVLTDEQNVRLTPNGTIVGIAQEGFYNVFDSTVDGKYLWYKIKDNLYIAKVEGRVIFIEGEDDLRRLKRENAKLKEILRQIHELSEVENG